MQGALIAFIIIGPIAFCIATYKILCKKCDERQIGINNDL